jgi:UDP-N-acetylglucosamine transferase subunit ALG13
MIFATAGTDRPFDRLLLGLDTWAVSRPHMPILAQTGGSRHHFRAIETVGDLSPPEFRALVEASCIVVAHARMDTAMSAAELGTPLVLMPRRARFEEHEDDHQLEIARDMARLSHVSVVENGEELHAQLDLLMAQRFERVSLRGRRSAPAAGSLMDFVRDFVWGRADPTEADPPARPGRAA